MATLNEISYNILNISKGGISSDDDRLTLRQIKFWIKYYRSYIIPKYSDFGKDIDPQLIQDMGCVTLTSVDKANCPEALWGCNIKKVSLPKLVDLPLNRSLVWVGLIDKQTPIILSDADVSYYNKFRKFTGNMRRAYLIGSSLYIDESTEDDLKYINIRGVFEDPEVVTICDSDNNCSCISDDDEYPLPNNMIPEVMDMILQKELNIIMSAQNDEVNNARGERENTK